MYRKVFFICCLFIRCFIAISFAKNDDARKENSPPIVLSQIKAILSEYLNHNDPKHISYIDLSENISCNQHHLGLTFFNKNSDQNSNESFVFIKKRAGILGGIGFNFANSIRGEIIVNHSKLKEDQYNKILTTYGKKNYSSLYFDGDNYRTMANVYYDFHNKTSFTTFLGAGVGLNISNNYVKFLSTQRLPTHHEQNFTNTITSNKAVFDLCNEFAYDVKAGLTYQMSEGFNIDLVYSIENIPKYQKIVDYVTSKFDDKLLYYTFTRDGTDTRFEHSEKKKRKNSILFGLRMQF